jgi:hypothetical protein
VAGLEGTSMTVWFEDIKVGTQYRGGEALVSREDIKRFAAEFDRSLFISMKRTPRRPF